MKKIFIIFVFLFWTSFAQATTYTVDAAGGYNYTTITDCAAAAQAGDTCSVRNGTYSGGVTPPRDGSSGAWITFQAASGHSPVMTGGWSLEGRNYIIIQGFTINGGSIDSNTYSGAACSNIKILDNTIQTGSATTSVNLKGSDILISGNTFNNTFNDGVRQFGQRWTVRNNVMISEVDSQNKHMDFWQTWCSGTSTGISAQYGVVEGNSYISISGSNVHFALGNTTSGCADPIVGMIFRYNKVHYIGSMGVYIDQNAAASGQTKNVVYNNTFSYLNEGSPATWQNYGSVLDASTNSRAINNISVNSMYPTGATGWLGSTGWAQSYNLYYDSTATMTFSGAASSETGAIKNQNPLLTNPAGNNFALQGGSPAINAGGPLTHVNAADTGSGTSLILDMVEFFQPGWGGSDADWIAVGTVSNVVQISSINYSSNTITLANTISRSDGDPVWLYKKSDGARVLYGSAPDIGAVETSDESDSTPPVMSSPLPQGSQSCSSNPRSLTLQVTTNENATCKYDTTDKSYDTMVNTYSSTGGLSHAQGVSVSCGSSFSYYTRCMDGSSNKNTSSVVSSGSVESQTVTGNISGAGSSGGYIPGGAGGDFPR